MKMFIYMSCALMTMGVVQAAAGCGDVYSEQQVILETISNGMRDVKGGGCHNPITGMLWDCMDMETRELGVMQVIVPSPEKGVNNTEKLVNAIIPFTHQKDKKGHLRTRHGIIFISRTLHEVLVEEQKHKTITPVIWFPIAKDIAVVRLLLEISTGGKYKLSQPVVDTSRPVALAAVQHMPPENQHRQHRGHGHGGHR